MEDSIHIKVINLIAKRNKAKEQNILRNLQLLNDNVFEEVYATKLFIDPNKIYKKFFNKTIKNEMMGGIL